MLCYTIRPSPPTMSKDSKEKNKDPKKIPDTTDVTKKDDIPDDSTTQEEFKHVTAKSKVNIGTNWTGNNISTLLNWISIAQYNIECLEMSINFLREQIRFNIILGLLLSTASGTISVANISFVSNENMTLILNSLFTAMSFIIALNTGRIKIYQVQERLEQFIKIKQDWTFFVTKIVSELQLPVDLRKDALYLIQTYKEKYLDLIKAELEIPISIKAFMEKKIQKNFRETWKKNAIMYHIHGSYTNSGIEVKNIIEDIAVTEGLRLIEAEKHMDYSPDKPINELYKYCDVNKKWNDLYQIFYNDTISGSAAVITQQQQLSQQSDNTPEHEHNNENSDETV